MGAASLDLLETSRTPEGEGADPWPSDLGANVDPYTSPAVSSEPRSPATSTEERKSGSPPPHTTTSPGCLTLVGLRQRVLPFQVLERLTRPDLPWPLPRPQQQKKKQNPGPIPSRPTPPPVLPPARGAQSHRHVSHRRPFIRSPPPRPTHWSLGPISLLPIGSC